MIPKRLLHYLLQRILGRYLDTLITLDQIELNLRDCWASVRNLTLNCKTLNRACGFIGDFRIVSGFISCARIDFPLNYIWGQSKWKISFDQVNLIIDSSQTNISGDSDKPTQSTDSLIQHIIRAVINLSHDTLSQDDEHPPGSFTPGESNQEYDLIYFSVAEAMMKRLVFSFQNFTLEFSNKFKIKLHSAEVNIKSNGSFNFEVHNLEILVLEEHRIFWSSKVAFDCTGNRITVHFNPCTLENHALLQLRPFFDDANSLNHEDLLFHSTCSFIDERNVLLVNVLIDSLHVKIDDLRVGTGVISIETSLENDYKISIENYEIFSQHDIDLIPFLDKNAIRITFQAGRFDIFMSSLSCISLAQVVKLKDLASKQISSGNARDFDIFCHFSNHQLVIVMDILNSKVDQKYCIECPCFHFSSDSTKLYMDKVTGDNFNYSLLIDGDKESGPPFIDFSRKHFYAPNLVMKLPKLDLSKKTENELSINDQNFKIHVKKGNFKMEGFNVLLQDLTIDFSQSEKILSIRTLTSLKDGIVILDPGMSKHKDYHHMLSVCVKNNTFLFKLHDASLVLQDDFLRVLGVFSTKMAKTQLSLTDNFGVEVDVTKTQIFYTNRSSISLMFDRFVWKPQSLSAFTKNLSIFISEHKVNLPNHSKDLMKSLGMTLVFSSDSIDVRRSSEDGNAMAVSLEVSKASFTPDTWSIMKGMVGKLMDFFMIEAKKDESVHSNSRARAEPIHFDVYEDDGFFLNCRFPIIQNSMTKKLDPMDFRHNIKVTAQQFTIDLTDQNCWLDNYVMIDDDETYSVAPENDYEECDMEFVHIPGQALKIHLSDLNFDFSLNDCGLLSPSTESNSGQGKNDDLNIHRWVLKGTVQQIEAISDNVVILRQKDLSSHFSSFCLSCVAPFDIEYRLGIDINAVKMSLDQDLLDFLTKFQDGNESQPLKIYFQFVEISSLDIELDFQPKIVASNVACANLLNSIQVKGVKLQLPAIEDGGFLGFTRLFDHISGKWIPSLIKDQRMNLLLGFGPVKSVANLGKGVSDFLVLPLKEYHSNGRLLSGFQAGSISLAKRTGHEALNLCSTIASASETLLDGTLHAIQSRKSKKVLGNQGEKAYAVIKPLLNASKRIELICRNLQDYLED